MEGYSGHPVLIVTAIAVAAPLLAELPIGLRLPAVVLEMILGILVGPEVLGLATASGLLQWMGGKLGLAALFFMAGLELDLNRARGRPLRLAFWGWLLSLILAFVTATGLHAVGWVQTPLLVAVALSTTTLGTLLPILRDAGDLDTRFGTLVLAAGAIGEFGPIVLVSLLFVREYTEGVQIALMLAFVAITLLVALGVLKGETPKVATLLHRTLLTSTQLPVRLAMFLLAGFVVLSDVFGIESALGAFAAGFVVGLATGGEDGRIMREKIDAIAFGFFVPFFFVTSGMRFDLAGLLQSPRAWLLVPVFLMLLLVVRGVPVGLYRKDLPSRERLPFALYSATTLPMVVAITELAVRTGRMASDTAAALVGASLLSVTAFPTLAGALRSRNGIKSDKQGAPREGG
jgi:Kef-type K+ transport system membrane component KefB